MNINKREILAAFKADLSAATPLKSQTDAKIKEWRDAYEGQPYGNEAKGKSAIISRDIKRQSEWQHASLVDPFVSTSEIVKCHPITYEDKEAARQNELLLNTQFCRKFDRFNFISNAIKLADIEGTVIVQTGWDYEHEEREVVTQVVEYDEFGNEFLTEATVTETVVTKNQPTAVICRTEDIYIDPTCMGIIDKAQFVIHRYETDLSTLRQDGRYRNLDKLAKATDDSVGDFTPEDDTQFKFTDEPRKKILVHEYWGNYDVDGDGIAEAIVCAWVGDVILRLETNPYPDKKPPFLVTPFNSVPFRLFGEANAELIGDNQKVKTAMLRGIIDNMAQSNNGQVGVRKNALDAVNKSRFLKGDNFEFNGSPADFWQGSYNQIPGSVFDMMGLMNNEIESLSGTKSFSGGITGASLGPSATAARGAMDATAVRRMLIVRNISENLIKPLMRKWMAYNAVFLEEEEVVRVSNEKFIPIKRDDLRGEFDLRINLSTPEEDSQKAPVLSMMTQTIGNTLDQSFTKMLLAKIARLYKIPDLAYAVENFNPQPDPMQQAMQEAELQRAQAEAKLLMAQAMEAEAKAQLNAAKIDVEGARAANMQSTTDKNNLDFYKDAEGIKHEEALEQSRQQAQADLQKEQMKQDSLFSQNLLKNQTDLTKEQIKANLQKTQRSD